MFFYGDCDISGDPKANLLGVEEGLVRDRRPRFRHRTR